MDKVIWKLIENLSYFLGNILMGVRVAFLPDYSLILSLLKHRDIEAFWTKKMENSNRKNSLNSSIDYIYKIKTWDFFWLKKRLIARP